jgi:hypothetical protein
MSQLIVQELIRKKITLKKKLQHNVKINIQSNKNLKKKRVHMKLYQENKDLILCLKVEQDTKGSGVET